MQEQRIAFIVSQELDLICMQSLIEHLLAHPAHKAEIYFITHVEDDKGALAAIDSIQKHGWSCRPLREMTTAENYFDYIFVSNPYLSDNVYRFLLGKQSKIVYIPYGYALSREDYSCQLHYNNTIHRLAWRIYALGDFFKDMYTRHCVTKGRNVKVIKTTPKFDNALRLSRIRPLEAKARIFLWNIHFNITPKTHGNGMDCTWSAYARYYAAVYKFFQSTPGTWLIIRPHHNLRANLEEPDHFLSGFTRLKNVTLEKSWETDYEKSFTMADALITDLSSMFYDFFVTGKPIVSLTYEKSCQMDLFSENLYRQYSYMLSEPRQLAETLEDLVAGKNRLKEKRIDALQKDKIFITSRPAYEIIAEDLGFL